ncbi:MAG: pseudouridine synthase [Bacteroidota bacterium]
MSKNQQFQKFIHYKSNAAKKEQLKQEKRSAKKERAASIEKRFEEKRLKKSGQQIPAPPVPHRAVKPGGPLTGAGKRQPPPADKKQGKTESTKLNPPTRSSRAGGRPVSTAQQPVVVSSRADDSMPLNKYVAHSGVCSRRDAADLIRQGEVKVNDVTVTEPGTKVSQKDTITIKGKKITPSKNLVYILLNKPKDYITTLDDPEGRKTVLDLVKHATSERVYPVGRLDRNTSGVLLITNDGDLAQTLSHPKNLIKKIYEVRLDKPVTKADFDQLLQGLELQDGFIIPDALGYTDPKDKTIIGIEIHSGRNRIVRRIFEHLGYDVRNLDRVTYAGLTKKNVQRGKWRFLTEKEVRILRHFNPQTKKDRTRKAPPSPAKKNAKK